MSEPGVKPGVEKFELVGSHGNAAYTSGGVIDGGAGLTAVGAPPGDILGDGWR